MATGDITYTTDYSGSYGTYSTYAYSPYISSSTDITSGTTTLSYDPANGLMNTTTSTATFIGYNSTVTLGGTLNYYNGTITIDGNTISPYGASWEKMSDFNKGNVEIKEGNVYIDGVLEMNPTKIGKAILMSIENDRKIEDSKDFFNKA